MGKNIKVNALDNPAKNFGGILKDMEKIAEEKEVSVQEMIKMFVMDLQNIGNEEYERNIKEIKIEGGISPRIKSELINYLNKSIKIYERREKNNKEKKKQEERKQKLEETWKSIEEEIKGKNNKKVVIDLISKIKEGSQYSYLEKTQKNYVLKKLEELVEQEAREERNKEELVRKRWKAIVEVVNKEADNSGKHKLEIWNKITEAIIANGNFGSISIPETMQEKILFQIEEQTKIEGKDYFEDVKHYTQNFEFLTGFRGTTFAIYGHRRFCNSEHSRMFENLIAKLSKNESVEYPETEEKFLKRVLSNNLVNTYYEKKIIEGRIDNIERDRIERMKEIYSR